MRDTEKAAIQAALWRYCAYQDRARSEVELKLRELGVEDQQEQEDWIASLEQDKMLDEARFARTYSRGKFYHKNWGRLRIRQELRRKGVSDSLIDTAWQTEIPEADYRSRMQELIRRKARLLQDVEPIKFKDKVGRFLLQKGFEWEKIVQEIHRFLDG
jgi:regulatory protein